MGRWTRPAGQGEPVELSDEMMLVTAAIILHTSMRATWWPTMRKPDCTLQKRAGKTLGRAG
ncbi:MAG: hypothetical protein NZ528_10370 [Caldilineales bacterium]|nr:hypothetical protein [Caldilineales bacterium]